MASPTLTDEQVAEQYGRRETNAVSLFAPYEWGYRCPKGHSGGLITWSEFKNHIWCYQCQLDYPSADCLMQRPSWMDPDEFGAFVSRLPFTPKVLSGVDYFLELLDAEVFISQMQCATRDWRRKIEELRGLK